MRRRLKLESLTLQKVYAPFFLGSDQTDFPNTAAGVRI
jgi:hypothetical protein